MSPPTRRVVHTETFLVDMRLADLDLDRLRRCFAELFDRAAHAVQLAGHEQDDAVLERFLVVRSALGQEVAVRADWLTDRERLLDHTRAAVEGESGTSADMHELTILGLRVVALVETGP